MARARSFEKLTRCASGGQQTTSHGNGSSAEITPVPTPETSRPTTPLAGHILSAKSGVKGGVSRRARKTAATSTNASSGDEVSRNKGKATKTTTKKMRRWDAEGMADEDDGVTLDYSATSPNEYGVEDIGSSSGPAGVDMVNAKSSGTRTGKGQFVLKDLDSEVHSILRTANEKQVQSKSSGGGVVGSSLGAISGLFRNVIGGKILTKEDLDKSMKGMEEHLLKKNVAREAAVRLCEGIERELIGVKTGSFESTLPLIIIPNNPPTDIHPRRRNDNSHCNGILSPQNPHAYDLPRHPPLHLLRDLSLAPLPHPPPALCNLHSRRQWRW